MSVCLNFALIILEKKKGRMVKSEIELGLSFKVPDLVSKFQIFAKGNLSY